MSYCHFWATWEPPGYFKPTKMILQNILISLLNLDPNEHIWFGIWNSRLNIFKDGCVYVWKTSLKVFEVLFFVFTEKCLWRVYGVKVMAVICTIYDLLGWPNPVVTGTMS